MPLSALGRPRGFGGAFGHLLRLLRHVNVGSARLDDQGDGADPVVLLDVHHPDPLRGAAHLRDAAGPGALNHPVLRDEQQVLVLADDQGTRQATLRARTNCRIGAFPPDVFERESIEQLAAGRRPAED